MTLLPDHTLFIQIANFLFLLLLMNILLYRPIRRVLAQRNEEFSFLEEKIEDYQNRAQRNEKDIEEGTIQTRKEGYMEKEHFKDQGLQEGKGMLVEASSSVEEKIGKARKEIEVKMADVRKALGDEAAAFSKELAEKILGRSV